MLTGILAAVLLVAPALAANKAIIILDASGSMWAQINGKARIEIARDSLKAVLAGVPTDLELGFMAYGHRSKGDCNDIELLVEPAAGTADQIAAAAAGLNPKGKTPLSASVKMAAEQLKYTEDKATVILITDGLETCEADPCALATELAKDGVDFKVDVVGLALSQDEADKVRCIADNTNGEYLQADDEDGLNDALNDVVTQVVEAPSSEEPTPPPSSEEQALTVNFAPVATLDENGQAVPDDAGVAWEFFKANADGTAGEQVRTEYGAKYTGMIDPGDYIIRGTLGFAHIQKPVTITSTEVAQPEYDFEAGFLDMKPIHSEGEDVNSGAYYEITLPNGEMQTGYGELQQFVPAGTSKLKVAIGVATAEDSVDVPAGEHVDKNVVVGAAHMSVSASYAEGTAVDNGSIYFSLQSAKKDIQGNRQEFTNGYGPKVEWDVAPGDYTLVTTLDAAKAEQPVSVKAGEAATIDVNLNAGLLVTTIGANDYLQVLSAKKNIEGKRVDFGGSYGTDVNRTLNAGDYHLVLTLADNAGTKEADVTIAAGERNEFSFP
jgi:Ca-activated chloride channel family protein